MSEKISDNMTNVLKKIKGTCCGCMACLNKCPHNAITLTKNNKGFCIPSVIDELCTNCGLCVKACPEISWKSTNSDSPKVYAFSADANVLSKSSSGGAFTVLANRIFELNGFVFGASWQRNFTVRHIGIQDNKDLDKLIVSKYVQSFIGFSYRQIQAMLKRGQYVLFSGTPCQVAGLKKFLSGKIGLI